MIKHDSMRGWFAYELHAQMQKNKDIYLLVGDLGYKVFDQHRRDFPDRVINCGAAEQAMMGIAVGMALEGKIPVVYSITSFLLSRPFEIIRNYINHEKIPVKLVGSGQNKDYKHDGFSHWSEDAVRILELFKYIDFTIPDRKEEIPELVATMLTNKKPYFLGLSR
jgi:transketolase